MGYDYIARAKPDGHGEIGELLINHAIVPRPGARTDLHSAISLLRTGGLKRVADEQPVTYIRNFRGFEALHAITAKARNPTNPPTVIWHFGPSGSGKSAWAFQTYPPDDIYVLPERANRGHVQWWTGYAQQPVVVLDELRPDTTPFTTLLRVLDRYPMRVPVSTGTFTQLNSPIFVITTPLTPAQYTQGQPAEQATQLFRRITTVIEHHADAETFPFTIDFAGTLQEAGAFVPPPLPPSQEHPSGDLHGPGAEEEAGDAEVRTGVPS